MKTQKYILITLGFLVISLAGGCPTTDLGGIAGVDNLDASAFSEASETDQALDNDRDTANHATDEDEADSTSLNSGLDSPTGDGEDPDSPVTEPGDDIDDLDENAAGDEEAAEDVIVDTEPNSSPIGAWRYLGTRAWGGAWQPYNDYGSTGYYYIEDRTLVLRPDGTWTELLYAYTAIYGEFGSLDDVNYEVVGRGQWQQQDNTLVFNNYDGTVTVNDFRARQVGGGLQLELHKGANGEVWQSSNFYNANGLSFWYPTDWSVSANGSDLLLNPPADS